MESVDFLTSMFGLESVVSDISSMITGLILNMGNIGVFILMTIESIGIPLPSEVIMPYGGFMASRGGLLDVAWATLAGVLGTGLGSAVGYWIGQYGGKAFVDRYGKFMGVTPHKMVWAEKWFCKYGESAVFYTRLLPVVRSIVNVPAGLLGMNFYKFLFYTMAGALPWCLFLTLVGFVLGDHWESITAYSHLLTYAIVGIIVIAAAACIIIALLVRQGIIKRQTIDKYISFLTKV